MTFFVRTSSNRVQVMPYVRRLCSIAEEHGVRLIFSAEQKDWLKDITSDFAEDAPSSIRDCSAVIALGGDGTIIHSAKLAAEAGKPVLGINAGHLGFTAGLEGDEIDEVCKLFSGEYTVCQRMLLDVSVDGPNAGENRFFHAINEAVISRGSFSRMIYMRVYHNDRTAIEFHADGLIVCTPTGSTAYSLSAGGPVIDPVVSCLTLTPLCPHSLFSRTTIFDDSARLSIEILPKDIDEQPDAYLFVDGESAVRIPAGCRVEICRSSVTADFVTIKQQCFSEILREKLYNR